MAGENENQNAGGGQPGQGAAPAFDPDKMRAVIREEIAQHINTEGKDNGYEPPVATPQPTQNPLQAVIDPLIAPHVNRAALAAQAAQDAAVFYSSHPEAVKYQPDIEQAFNQLIAQGTPFTRQAVWEWYRGKNFDKFVKEEQEKDQAKINAANNVADGGGGIRPAGGPVKDAFTASDDELKNALNGVSF